MQSSSSDAYGYSEEYPIKVGGVEQDEGVQREYQYLSFLTGPENQPLSFMRVGSCCYFKYRIGQSGLLDKFRITYKGLNDTLYLYLDIYRMEGLSKIPKGFKLNQSIRPKISMHLTRYERFNPTPITGSAI